MARFVFRLEAVLKQRRWEEQQRQRDFAQRQAQLTELQQRLKQNAEQVQAANEEMRANRLVGELDLSFLAAHRRFLAAMQRAAIEMMQRMAIASRQVEEARVALSESAKRRRAIEKLREKHFARWRLDQNRREIRQLDEIGMQMSQLSAARRLTSVAPRGSSPPQRVIPSEARDLSSAIADSSLRSE